LIYPAGNADGLVQVSVGGGEAKVVSTVDRAKGERTHRWPYALPGGKVVLFTVGMQESPDDYDNAVIEALVLATGERRRLLKAASMAVYVPSGHLVFARAGSLYSVGFDVDSLTVREPAQLVQQGVAGDPTTGAAHFSVAADGTLAYASGGLSVVGRRLAWADRRGNLEPLPLPAGAYGDPRLSPDGSRLAVTLETSTARDIWLYTFSTNAFTRFTFGGRNWTPLWSADGKTIFYVTSEAGLRTTLQRQPADGSTAAEHVAQIDGEAYLTGVTDRMALFGFRDPKAGQFSGKFQGIALDLAAPHAVTPLIARSIVGGVLSADGRFLAYGNDDSGRPEIYVTDFPGLRGRWQVTTGGGEEPHWSRNGDELFLRFNDQLMAVRVDKARAFQTSAPVLLFKGIYNVRPVTMLSFSVDSTRDRFLMLRPAQEGAGVSQLRIVLNWSQELGRRVPAQ
jgi:serine/threonine-protein kinase